MVKYFLILAHHSLLFQILKRRSTKTVRAGHGLKPTAYPADPLVILSLWLDLVVITLRLSSAVVAYPEWVDLVHV